MRIVPYERDGCGVVVDKWQKRKTEQPHMTSLDTKNNLTQEEVLTELDKKLKENKPWYESVRISCSALDLNGKWQNMLSMIHVFPTGGGAEKRSNHLYHHVSLLEEWISLEELVPFLEEIRKQVVTVSDHRVHLHPGTEFREFEHLPSGSDYDPRLPGHLYRASCNASLPILNQPLLQTDDSPFYSNTYEAISDWSGIRPFYGSSDARLGGILVFLPECRARFVSLNPMEGRLVIKVESGRPEIGELRVKGAWKHMGKAIPFDQRLDSLEAQIDMPDNPEEVEIYLIDSIRIYDSHRETRNWSLGQQPVLTELELPSQGISPQQRYRKS